MLTVLNLVVPGLSIKDTQAELRLGQVMNMLEQAEVVQVQLALQTVG
jgi:hypothetical protein